jgi:transposase
MEKYIGIDISKATLDLYDGDKSYKVGNNREGFTFIRKLAKDKKDLVLIFEPTGVYAHALISYCEQQCIRAVIVGSKEARDYARSIKQRSKTDKIDAKVLYRYQTQVDPSTITIPTLDSRMIRITQRRNVYDKYQHTITQLRNLIEATHKEDKALIRSLQKQIASLQQSADTLLKEIENLLVKNESNQTALENLQTIPGIGRKSAIALLLEFMRYPHAKSNEMVALMGLDPVLRDSGVFKGKSRISKQGGKHLRQKLYMATIVAIKHNDRLKHFYERLVSHGKPKMVALLAAMRKLLRIAFALVKNNEPYRALV